MFQIAWGFLVITALFGFLLRLQLVYPVPGIHYGNLLHAHSHIAFLGWVFNAFFALALHALIPKQEAGYFIRWFVILQVANLGMLIAYPIQGYAAVSIAFTTLHLIAALAFAIRLWTHHSANQGAVPYLKASLVFMLLSGIGPLALGPLAVLDMRSSPLYELAVYWYLHFQYNGWFICFLLALFIQRLPATHMAAAGTALPYWISGIILTFLLSVLWLQPPLWVYGLAGAGGLLQLIGFGRLASLFIAERQSLVTPGTIIRTLVLIGFSALLIKNLMQLFAAWPSLVDLVNHRFMVIGFLHWVFLVVVTPILTAEALRLNWLPDTKVSRTSIHMFMFGVLLTQSVLFGAPLNITFGLSIPETTLAAAGLMLMGSIGAMAGKQTGTSNRYPA